MPNVDKELHNPEVTNANLIKERTTSKPKRALRGAAGGTYVGPVLSTAAIGDSSITHATGIAAGGGGDRTGVREADPGGGPCPHRVPVERYLRWVGSRLPGAAGGAA